MIKRNSDNVFAIASSNQCEGARPAAVSLFPGGATRIPRATASPPVKMTPPDAQHNTKEANTLSTYVEKWKSRYEDAERKHKAALLKAEKGKREFEELQRRHAMLAEEQGATARMLADRERALAELSAASERLCLEYQQLRNKHDVDADVMNKVLAQAGQWYHQNKQLKRRSAVLMQALPAKGIDIDFTDSNDTASDASSNEEVEFLKRTVAELSRELADLQTRLGHARLQEFEAQEASVGLAQELEGCQARCAEQTVELEALRAQAARHERVARLLLAEVDALRGGARDRDQCEAHRSEARAARHAAALAHQAALLAGAEGAGGAGGEPLGAALAALAAREDRDLRLRDQIEELQLKLTEKHEDTDILLWEEKIRLAEDEARAGTQRAERAERRLADTERRLADTELKLTEVSSKLAAVESKITTNKLLETVALTESVKLPESGKLSESVKLASIKLSDAIKPKKSNLMSRICYFESGAAVEKMEEVRIEEKAEEKEVQEIAVVLPTPTTPSPAEIEPLPPAAASVSPPPPPSAPPAPPPPPCPPPPPPPPPAFVAPAGDMASMLASRQGTLRRNKQNAENGASGAIDAIVDQIKGGKFHLKSAACPPERRKPDATPEAVKEMLAVLGTLRKRRPAVRPAVDYTDF